MRSKKSQKKRVSVKRVEVPMPRQDIAMLIICTVRYALTRRSVICTIAGDYVLKYRDALEVWELGVIIRDIEEAIGNITDDYCLRVWRHYLDLFRVIHKEKTEKEDKDE